MTVGLFSQLEMRAGKILSAERAAGLRIHAYILSVDFGRLGVRQSVAQVTKPYDAAELIGRNVIAVTNLRPRQVGR